MPDTLQNMKQTLALCYIVLYPVQAKFKRNITYIFKGNSFSTLTFV